MWVKICGLTTVAEAVAVARLKPDAIGLNFYERSPRAVAVEIAAEICRELPADVLPVGLFVNHTAEQIAEIARITGIHALQLHGDYPLEIARQLPPLPVIWAYRMGPEGLTGLQQQLPELPAYDHSARSGVWSYLIDARVQGHYGGSGHQVDWELLVSQYDVEEIPRLILAGGLTPENVTTAINTVRPWGVDVASGVEIDGKKDLIKCRVFINNARRTAGQSTA